MRRFAAFVRKEFHHILRDRRTMLILIGVPVVQIILFGFAISTEVKNVQTVVLVTSADADTRYVVYRLDASEYFSVKYVVHSIEEVDCLFRQGKAELAVVFHLDLSRQRIDAEKILLIYYARAPEQGG